MYLKIKTLFFVVVIFGIYTVIYILWKIFILYIKLTINKFVLVFVTGHLKYRDIFLYFVVLVFPLLLSIYLNMIKFKRHNKNFIKNFYLIVL